MEKYSITELFMVLAFVSSMSFAANTNGLGDEGFLFVEYVEFSFKIGRNNECIVSLVEEKEDIDPKKCYQKMKFDSGDADETTWGNVKQNCGNRDVFFLHRVECDSSEHQSSNLGCSVRRITETYCREYGKKCCAYFFFLCTRDCKYCKSYGLRHEEQIVCG